MKRFLIIALVCTLISSPAFAGGKFNRPMGHRGLGSKVAKEKDKQGGNVVQHRIETEGAPANRVQYLDQDVQRGDRIKHEEEKAQEEATGVTE